MEYFPFVIKGAVKKLLHNCSLKRRRSFHAGTKPYTISIFFHIFESLLYILPCPFIAGIIVSIAHCTIPNTKGRIKTIGGGDNDPYCSSAIQFSSRNDDLLIEFIYLFRYKVCKGSVV